MSKGVTEGKANGRLNMDELDRMAFIGPSSVDSIAVDSANSMSAYMTGHKTSVNALGVYADRTPSSLDDPRVETIAEALDSDRDARTHWNAFPPSVRKQMLWWVISAAKEDTRARRIATIVSEAAAGRRARG